MIPLALILFLCTALAPTTMPTQIPDPSTKPWTVVEGGVTRADTSKKQLALIFTGGDFGEGTPHILDTLKAHNIKASFFVTGDFIRKVGSGFGVQGSANSGLSTQDSALSSPEPRTLNPEPSTAPEPSLLKRIIAEGHYLGPHSDKHPLYCPWEDRSKTLITEAEFKKDLQRNIADLKQLGALKEGITYFIPPYEWYNKDQSNWSREENILLFNFTPGSGSNRDWAPEDHKSFVPSQKIVDDILAYEKKDPHGLNGFLLLLHLGSQRKDKTFLLLDPLLKELENRRYTFQRIDELLAP